MLALALASCGTYKRYERPAQAVEGLERLYGPDTTATDTASIASLPWTELFTDPALQALIREGLANNTDLGIARLRVEEAEATLFTSRLAYLPSLTLAPQGQLGSYDGVKPDKTYSIAASAEWEVDLFGRLTNAKRGARAALEQSEAYRQAVQTQLVATIANSYYNLLTLDRQLDISLRTLDSWTEIVRTYEVRKRVGEANEAAVGVPLQLLERRPDVRQAEAALAQAFYNTNAARSAFYPRITLSGSAGWTNNSGSAIINPGNWLLSALGSLTQPLFQRGQNIANLRIAKARQEEALLSFRQSLLRAGNEVNDALAQWQTARSRLVIDAEQLDALHKAVRSTQQLMEHSTSASYLEVLTARQALLQAELTETNDRFDQIQGIINLYHALGGGSE